MLFLFVGKGNVMANVRLGRFEAEQGKLPGVCMYCGASTSRLQPRRFLCAAPRAISRPACFGGARASPWKRGDTVEWECESATKMSQVFLDNASLACDGFSIVSFPTGFVP